MSDLSIDEAFEIFARGAGVAASKMACVFDEKMQETIAFPIWQDTVHEILIGKGCPCLSGDDQSCFLSYSPDEQRELFQDQFWGFDNFMSALREGQNMFFDFLRSKAHVV